MQLDIKPISKCQVLIVDDDEIIRLTLEAMLTEYVEVVTLSESDAVIPFCQTHIPDLILLDVQMPGMSGLELCEIIKSHPATEHIPVIFITSTYDVQSQNNCWEAGANDFIAKPVNASTLFHRVHNHLENKLRLEALIKLTYKDVLTGAYNRLYLKDEASSSFKQCKREGSVYSLLMLDIDYFKLYNDFYGHLEGDACLKDIAAVLTSAVKRPQDVVIRFGGEEFLILLPFTDHVGADAICREICSKLGDINIPHDLSPLNRVSVSIGGITCIPSQTTTLEMLLKQADEALYEVKRANKNNFKLVPIP